MTKTKSETRHAHTRAEANQKNFSKKGRIRCLVPYKAREEKERDCWVPF